MGLSVFLRQGDSIRHTCSTYDRGNGEQLTLRVVAEHANLWNAIGPIEDLARKAVILDQYCADIGYDPTRIARSVQPRLDSTDPAAMIDLLSSFIDIGFTDNVVYIPPCDDPAGAARVATERVLPEVRQLL